MKIASLYVRKCNNQIASQTLRSQYTSTPAIGLVQYSICGEQNGRKYPYDSEKMAPFDDPSYNIVTSYVDPRAAQQPPTQNTLRPAALSSPSLFMGYLPREAGDRGGAGPGVGVRRSQRKQGRPIGSPARAQKLRAAKITAAPQFRRRQSIRPLPPPVVPVRASRFFQLRSWAIPQ